MTTPQTNFIGISVSGTRARAALVNDEGLVGEARVGEIAPKTLIPQLAEMVQELQSSRLPVGAIGVAIPGLVNRQTDRVVAPRDLPATIVENLHGELTRATGLRVEIENDANAAAYGEYKSARGEAPGICFT